MYRKRQPYIDKQTCRCEERQVNIEESSSQGQEAEVMFQADRDKLRGRRQAASAWIWENLFWLKHTVVTLI